MDNQNENYFCDESTFVPFFLSSVRKMEYSSGPDWRGGHRLSRATLRERENCFTLLQHSVISVHLFTLFYKLVTGSLWTICFY